MRVRRPLHLHATHLSSPTTNSSYSSAARAHGRKASLGAMLVTELECTLLGGREGQKLERPRLHYQEGDLNLTLLFPVSLLNLLLAKNKSDSEEKREEELLSFKEIIDGAPSLCSQL